MASDVSTELTAFVFIGQEVHDMKSYYLKTPLPGRIDYAAKLNL